MQASCRATRDPSWGHPRCGLGAVGAVLEPFRGHLSPKIDKVSCKLTFEIPPRRTLGGGAASTAKSLGLPLVHCICTPQGMAPEVPGQGKAPWCFAFSPDKKRVVSGSEDTLVRVWDVETGALVSSLA